MAASLGWGYATNKDSELQLGVWGWIWAKHLSATYNMPVCIINGAVGGTRIDQHQPNPAGHALPGSLYSIYATLYNRIVGANLTHGIRGVLWHQGEQDQGSGGPDGDYDYKFHQQYFVDMSAAWKQDFPNIQKYYIFQIWPAACGDTSRNDQLREVQRTLPSLYSNMRIMSTLGIVPGSSCHYVLEGYQKFSDLISPLVEQDFYGYSPGTVFSAPNLTKPTTAPPHATKSPWSSTRTSPRGLPPPRDCSSWMASPARCPRAASRARSSNSPSPPLPPPRPSLSTGRRLGWRPGKPALRQQRHRRPHLRRCPAHAHLTLWRLGGQLHAGTRGWQ